MARESSTALVGAALLAITIQYGHCARMVIDQSDKVAADTEQGCDADALASCQQLMSCDSADGCQASAFDVSVWTTSKKGRVEQFYKTLGVAASPTCTALCKAAVNAVPDILRVKKPTKAGQICIGKDCSSVIDVADENLDVVTVDEEQGKVDLEHPVESSDVTDLSPCTCTQWVGGAMFTDRALCSTTTADTNVCTPLQEDGSCARGTQKCGDANKEKEPNLPHDDESDSDLLRRLLSNVFDLMPGVDVVIEGEPAKGSVLMETRANASEADPVLGGYINADVTQKRLVEEAIGLATAWLSVAAKAVGSGQANAAMQNWLGQSDVAFAQKQVKLINSVVSVLDNARIKNGGMSDPERICFNHVAPMAFCKGSPTGCTPGRGCAKKDTDGRYEIFLCPKIFDYNYFIKEQFISHGHNTHAEALAAILIHEAYHHASVPQIMDQNDCGGMQAAHRCAQTQPTKAQNAGYNYQHMVSEAAIAMSNFKGAPAQPQTPVVHVQQPGVIMHQTPVHVQRPGVIVHQTPGVIVHQTPTVVQQPTGVCARRPCCLAQRKEWGPGYGHSSINSAAVCQSLSGQWFP